MVAKWLLGNSRADNQLTIGGPGYQCLMALARSHLTVEKYNNEYRENILPFCNFLPLKTLIMCDAYLTACLHRTCLNMKLSMNQYNYLGKDGHKLKLFYHAYGYYKNIAHKSNIYKNEKAIRLQGNAHLCLYSSANPHPEYLWGRVRGFERTSHRPTGLFRHFYLLAKNPCWLITVFYSLKNRLLLFTQWKQTYKVLVFI